MRVKEECIKVNFDTFFFCYQLINIEKRIIDIFKYRAEKEGFVINKLLESD